MRNGATKETQSVHHSRTNRKGESQQLIAWSQGQESTTTNGKRNNRTPQ